MKFNYLLSLLVYWIVIPPTNAFSQIDKGQRNLYIEKSSTNRDSIEEIQDSIKETLPSIEFNSEISNKVVFWGRTFGVNQIGLDPTIVFNTGKGLYFYTTSYYWSQDADPNLFAKSDFGLGYYKKISKNWSIYLNYEKWKYFNGDNFVRNAITNSLEANATLSLDWINVESSLYYLFGNIKIVELNVNVSQEFDLFQFGKHTNVSFFPELATVFADKNFLPIYSDFPSNFQNINSFRLLNVALNLPFVIQMNNVEIEPVFHLNFPIQQPNESVKPFHYTSLKLAYTFYFQKDKLKDNF